MKTYKNLYTKLCSPENLELAFKKARKRKTKKWYVIEFEKNLSSELEKLRHELETGTYNPKPLQRFIIKDPKTRVIHASKFRDRVVYHALVNILEPIYEKIFIYDSYAGRLRKGAHNAITRFDRFKRKASKNGKQVRNAQNNNQIQGYALKADIRHYFEAVNHQILIRIIKRKITDEKVIRLIQKILSNFDTKVKGRGMPLGNLTSQFFANVYLNELDYFVKHELKAKYYIRYVDDFVVLHEDKNTLRHCQNKINAYLKTLKLELHTDKSKIMPLRNGLTFLGYRIFYHYKLLRRSNLRKFQKSSERKPQMSKIGGGRYSYEAIHESLQGWSGYAQWANTYNLRKAMAGGIQANFNPQQF